MTEEIATTTVDDGGGEFDAHAAAAELSERRAQLPPRKEIDQDEEAKKPIVELRRLDDAENLTVRQSAQDLAEYRAQLAARLDGENPSEAAPVAEQSAERTAQPDPVQERQPRTATDLLSRAEQLIKSESPEDRTAAAELVTHAARQVTADNLALMQQTGQGYGQAVQQLEGVVAAHLLAEFGSVDPAELAAKNPAAFARLNKMAAIYQGLHQQTIAQQQDLQRISSAQWQAWAQQQDVLASKAVPEANDPKFQAAANESLNDYGFKPDELAAAYSGRASFNMRDARVQRVLADATKYRQVSKAGREAMARPLPQVQRPGVSQPYAKSEISDAVRALDGRLSRSGHIKDAAALLSARRRSR